MSLVLALVVAVAAAGLVWLLTRTGRTEVGPPADRPAGPGVTGGDVPPPRRPAAPVPGRVSARGLGTE